MKLIIKGQYIEVVIVKNQDIIDTLTERGFDVGKVYDGTCNDNSRTILISEDLKHPEAKKEVLRHEALHMLHHLYNDNVLSSLENVTEETVVRLTTPMFKDIADIENQIQELFNPKISEGK